MNAEFYSLETLILMHLSERASWGGYGGTREYCDRGFLDALATENNQ